MITRNRCVTNKTVNHRIVHGRPQTFAGYCIVRHSRDDRSDIDQCFATFNNAVEETRRVHAQTT